MCVDLTDGVLVYCWIDKKIYVAECPGAWTYRCFRSSLQEPCICSIVRNIAWSIGVKLTATKKFVLVTVIARPKGVALNAFYDQNWDYVLWQILSKFHIIVFCVQLVKFNPLCEVLKSQWEKGEKHLLEKSHKKNWVHTKYFANFKNKLF